MSENNPIITGGKNDQNKTLVVINWNQICAKIIDMLLVQYVFLNLIDPDSV